VASSDWWGILPLLLITTIIVTRLDHSRQVETVTALYRTYRKLGCSRRLSIAAPDYAKILSALNLTTLSNPILKPERIASIFTNYLGWDQSQPDPKGGNRWFKGGSLDCCATSVCHSMNGFSYALFYNRGFAMDPPKSGGGWPIWPDLDTGMSGTIMSAIDLFSDPSINLGSIWSYVTKSMSFPQSGASSMCGLWLWRVHLSRIQWFGKRRMTRKILCCISLWAQHTDT